MPVTIKIIPPATVLLVTGPNTGGKTVALKTAGLLALMAQAGLRIPAADGSRLPVFRSVFADIGDEQSIDASLSTFSAHIANIASMDRTLGMPALVLLDEVGSGTDPIEGGALGVAIVDHFRRRGATVMATSHYDALKTYASTTDGVASAAFGFDAETFAPTYELTVRLAGPQPGARDRRAPRPDPSVVAAARQNLSAREAQLAEHLAKIDRDMRALEHEHRLAARERETLEAEARMRQREDALKQREETFRRRLNEELDTQVRQARREIDDVIAGLKAKTDAMAHGAAGRPVTTGETGSARSDARAAVDAVVQRVLEPVREAPRAQRRPTRAGRSATAWSSAGLGSGGGRHGDSRRIGRARRARQAHARERPRSARRSVAAPAEPGQRPRRAAAARRGDDDGSQCHRLQRRRSDRARRAVPRRIAADRSARRAVHSRVRHRSVEAGARRLSAAASARRQVASAPPEQGGGRVGRGVESE